MIEDVVILNAEKSLDNEKMLLFLNLLDKSEEVDIICENSQSVFTYSKKDIQEFFMNPEVEDIIEENEIITFVSKKVLMTITGKDFKDIIAPYRNKKYGKVKSLFKVSKPTTKNNIIKVSINCGEEIETFEGTKKECIDFLNKYYGKFKLKYFDNEPILFCLNDDKNKWFTFDELLEKGDITL